MIPYTRHCCLLLQQKAMVEWVEADKLTSNAKGNNVLYYTMPMIEKNDYLSLPCKVHLEYNKITRANSTPNEYCRKEKKICVFCFFCHVFRERVSKESDKRSQI